MTVTLAGEHVRTGHKGKQRQFIMGGWMNTLEKAKIHWVGGMLGLHGGENRQFIKRGELLMN